MQNYVEICRNKSDKNICSNICRQLKKQKKKKKQEEFSVCKIDTLNSKIKSIHKILGNFQRERNTIVSGDFLTWKQLIQVHKKKTC